MSSSVTCPCGARPSKVAALTVRLRTVIGPSCAGAKTSGVTRETVVRGVPRPCHHRPMTAGLVARLRRAGCVFAEEEAAVLAGTADGEALEGLVRRREAGEPLEYVVGWADFAGIRVVVAPGVFVPRRRSELLVRLAASVLVRGDVVVDLGCGTGALAAAVAARVEGLEVHAVDVDPDAVVCARRNLPGAHVVEGDLYRPLPPSLRGRVALVLANAPYVPSDRVSLLPAEARDHERRTALDGGPDGLDVVRRVVGEAPTWLRPGGRLLVETSARQAGAVCSLMGEAGLAPVPRRAEDVDGCAVHGRRTEPTGHRGAEHVV